MSPIYETRLDNQGRIDGNEDTPLVLPVFDPLPPFQQAVLRLGAEDVDVPDDGFLDLPAGDYNDIRVGNNATIRFLGGPYNVRSIDAGGGSKVLFVTASDVRLEGRFLTGNDAEGRPEDGAGIGAADVIFSVNTTNSVPGPAASTIRPIWASTWRYSSTRSAAFGVPPSSSCVSNPA